MRETTIQRQAARRRARPGARAGSASGAASVDLADGAGNGWLDAYVPYLLYRVTNKLNARLLERLRATRTNPARWRVLSVLRAYGTLRVNDVVEHTLMGQPTVSRVIDQLEREGRVTRKPDPADSRATRVALTPKGVATFAAIVPTAMRHAEIALRGLAKRDLDAIARVLGRIERNIDAAVADDSRPTAGRRRAGERRS